MVTLDYLKQLKPGTYAIFKDSVLQDMIFIGRSNEDNTKQCPRSPISCVFGVEEGSITKWEQYFNFEHPDFNKYVIVPSKDINLHTGLTSGINNVRFQLCNK